MPDPGIAPTPPVPDGQRDLQDLQGGGYPADKIAAYKADVTHQLQAGKYSQADIQRYWGDTPPPVPHIQAAAADNVRKADGTPSILSDPLKFLAGAVGTYADAWHPYMVAQRNEIAKAGASAQAGLAQFDEGQRTAGSLGGTDFLNTSGRDLAGAAMLGGAAWSYVVSPFTAFLNEKGSLDTAVHAIPIPEFGPKGWRMGGPLPEGFTGDTASLIAGFTVGGVHGEPPAVIPEAMRYKAIDATHAGALQGGPADIVTRLAGDSPQTAPIKAALPSAIDFVAHAADIVGAPDHVAIGHVEKNLQQIWASAGTHPADAADLAKTDGTYREELLTQNVAGEPVAPHYQAFSPPAPKPLETAEPTLPEKTRLEGPASGPTKFQNSVTTSMEIMRQLESSADNAVSRTGAVGRYQIEPSTARQYGFDPAQLKDPAYNAAAARTIITDLYHRFNGNMEAMSIAYNGGPRRAAEWLNAGEGTRLEAERDNSVKSGWRYTKVPDPRDESFLPVETQQYVARAREKMHYPEDTSGGGEVEGKFPSADHTTEATDKIMEEEKASAAERAAQGEEPIEGDDGKGSGGSASAWTDSRPVGDAYDEIGANIGDKDPPAAKGLSWYDQMITDTMSRLQPAKAADDVLREQGALNPDKEFGVRDAFAYATKSDQRFIDATNDGPLLLDKFNQETTVQRDGPTAKAALAEANKTGNTPDFMKWLVARRAGTLEENGTNSGFNIMAADRIMRDAGERAKYEKAADIWDGYTKGVRSYAQAAGRFNEAQMGHIEEVGNWVSFRRLMGDDASFAGAGKGFGIGNPLKRMEGSDRQITDPLLASLDNMRMMIQSADRNLAAAHLVDLATRFPDFALQLGLKKIGLAAAPDMDALDNALAHYGIPEDKMEAAREAFGTMIQDRQELKGNQFSYYNDGVKEVWETAWPELANMIRGSTPVQRGMLTKVFQDIAGAARTGIVAIPDFAIRTFASHQMIQFINNPLHPPPFLTGTVGLIKQMGMTDLLSDLRANGALGTSMEAMDKDVLYDTMTEVLGHTGALGKVRNDISQFNAAPSAIGAAKVGIQAVLTPIRLVRALQERLDFGNRAGLYQQGLNKGMTPWKAGANAAEGGIDYTNGPANALIQWWSSMVPFMRPALLYHESALKAIERNPAAYIGYATAAVTIPKMVLFGLNMMADAIPAGQPGYVPPEDKYANLHDWEKTYYYITPPINGQRFKLRMPADAGFGFGAVPEMIMKAMHDHDPVQFKSLFSAFLNEYLPPVLPPGIKAPAEVATNVRFDTFQPLVPSSLSGSLPELQYTPNTSSPARALAKVLGPPLRSIGLDTMSPIAMDHMVQGWTGQGGQLALNAVSATMHRPGPPTDIADIPFVHGFMLTHPGLNGQILTDYYDQKRVFDQEAASKAVIKRDAKEGDQSNTGLAPEAWAYAQADQRISKISQALGAQRDTLWGIYENKDMSVDEKRQHIDQIVDQSLALAAAATKGMKSFKADLAKGKASGLQPEPEPGAAP